MARATNVGGHAACATRLRLQAAGSIDSTRWSRLAGSWPAMPWRHGNSKEMRRSSPYVDCGMWQRPSGGGHTAHTQVPAPWTGSRLPPIVRSQPARPCRPFTLRSVPPRIFAMESNALCPECFHSRRALRLPPLRHLREQGPALAKRCPESLDAEESVGGAPGPCWCDNQFHTETDPPQMPGSGERPRPLSQEEG